jgi:hypothetical protein
MLGVEMLAHNGDWVFRRGSGNFGLEILVKTCYIMGKQNRCQRSLALPGDVER